MPLFRLCIVTSLALVAFAANSLLCRAALAYTTIDPASFTSIRLVSGALVLWFILQLKNNSPVGDGNWFSALTLFVYAAGFSFAYLSLPAAVGALILFATVQTTMIGFGIWQGERLDILQTLGLCLAFCGLIALLMPGLSAPPLAGTLLMMIAGISWGIYSLRGKGQGDPLKVTAGNFLRAAPIAVALSLVMFNKISLDSNGFLYAVLSGVLASGFGYAIWYTALPYLRATHAATLQLSVPVIATLGAVSLLHEPLTLQFILSSVTILGGIALVILVKPKQ